MNFIGGRTESVTYTLSGGSTRAGTTGLTTAASLSLLAGRTSKTLHSGGALENSKTTRAQR